MDDLPRSMSAAGSGEGMRRAGSAMGPVLARGPLYDIHIYIYIYVYIYVCVFLYNIYIYIYIYIYILGGG